MKKFPLLTLAMLILGVLANWSLLKTAGNGSILASDTALSATPRAARVKATVSSKEAPRIVSYTPEAIRQENVARANSPSGTPRRAPVVSGKATVRKSLPGMKDPMLAPAQSAKQWQETADVEPSGQAPIIFVDPAGREQKAPLPAVLAPLNPELDLTEEQRGLLNEIADEVAMKINEKASNPNLSAAQFGKFYAATLSDSDIYFRTMFGERAFLQQMEQVHEEANSTP